MTSIIYIGMDVHSTNYTLCAFSLNGQKVFGQTTINPSIDELLKYLATIQGRFGGKECRLICGYEAGCLGYTLYHQLTYHNQSKNFPPEFLEVITQNRKNRRVILGTSQVFTRLSKPLREQCTEVRACYTLFGCLTIVLRKEPVLDSAGEVTEYKRRGMYWFVHTEEIRNAYDTYHVIESLAKCGFQDAAPSIPAPRVYVANGNTVKKR